MIDLYTYICAGLVSTEKQALRSKT